MQRASEGVCEMDSVQCSREHEGKNIIPLYRLKSVSHVKKPMIIVCVFGPSDEYSQT